MATPRQDEEAGVTEQTPLLMSARRSTVRHTISRMPEETSAEIVETGGTDILQFAAPMFIADELEPFLYIDVVRLGTCEGNVAISYYSKDGSARSGQDYQSVKGRLVFTDGEQNKTIEIPILEDGLWETTMDFKLKLHSPQNCKMGSFLHTTRVKILNEDAFPTEACQEHFKQRCAKEGALPDPQLPAKHGIHLLPIWFLFAEFCKLNFLNSRQQGQTMLILVMDQLNNVAIFGYLWVGVYMVDTLFARGVTAEQLIVDGRYNTAMAIAMWYVVPNILLYIWDRIKTNIDIPGTTREFLQLSLLSTYLNYTHDSMSKVTSTDMAIAVDDSAQALAEGYAAVVNMGGLIGRIVTISIFIVAFQRDLLAISSVLLMVLLLLVFTGFRVRITQYHQECVEEKRIYVDLLTAEASANYDLLHSYSKRSQMSEMFGKAIHEFSETKIPETIVRLNTRYTTRFLSGFFIAVYIVAKTPAVLNHDLSLGIFLATITIFSTYLADAISELNTQLMFILDAFVPLKEFTMYLNLPLELAALKSIFEDCRDHTRDGLQKAKAAQGKEANVPGVLTCDLIPIEVKNLSFEYTPGNPVITGVNLELVQGKMFSVIGPHMAGKATLLKLLANITVPTDGHVRIPSHLRVIHVSREPMFLQASMLSNLCLGLPSHETINMDRLCEILSLCGLPEMANLIQDEVQLTYRCNEAEDVLNNDIITFTDPSKYRFDWCSSLSHSQKIKLHVARAIIANPNVIIIQRSLEGLNEEAACAMIDVLRKHVDERGLCLGNRESRRPRNVIFSTESWGQAEKADLILKLDHENKTIRPVTSSRSLG